MKKHSEQLGKCKPISMKIVIIVLLIAYITPHAIPQNIAPNPNFEALSNINNGSNKILPMKNFIQL